MLNNRISEIEIYKKLSRGEISKEEAMARLTDYAKYEAAEDMGWKDTLDNIDKILPHIGMIVSNNLHLPEGELEYHLSFKELGVDSINGIEIIRDVNQEFGLSLDAVILYDYPTVHQLSKLVLEETNKNRRVLERKNNHNLSPSVEDILKSSDVKPDTIKLPNIALGGKTVHQEAIMRDTNIESKRHLSLEEPEKKVSSITSNNMEASIVKKLEDLPLIKEDQVLNTIAEIVSDNLHLPEEELGYNLSFKDLGVDSINGLEIVRDINLRFSLNLDAVVLYDYSTVSMLTQHVMEQINEVSKTLQVFQPQEKAYASTTPEDNHRTTKKDYDEENKVEGKITLKPLPVSKKEISNGEKAPLPHKDRAAKQPSTALSTVEQQKNLSDYQEDDIAIIGISGRFPGASNVDEFWDNLITNTDSITPIPKERWDIEKHYDSHPRTPYKTYSKVGGFLDNIDKFDPLFFNIPPVEAISMDPQQRLFLEEAWRALEDAGCSDMSLSDTKCGVFVGAAQGDYMKELTTGEAFTGMASSMFAARISYFLNLIGPSITVDTACSSSLVALHLGCQSLKSGDSHMAIVGGVRLNVTQELHVVTSNLEMLSHKGQCRTFDQSADGTIMSEGVGAIVIKPLKKAIEDKHTIYGIIRGSGINQDGKTNGITAPSTQSQERLERAVYEQAKINPEEINYVEAHGTGTKLGDPIEVKALAKAFSAYTTKKQYCPIGSVKSNIGHATNAAGIIGVIKILLAMKHSKIPATLHYERANEHIPFEDTPFYVNQEPIDWKPENRLPKLAAVSSFGFSGTNAHVLVQEYRAKTIDNTRKKAPYYLITISAKSQEVYDKKIEDLCQWLDKNREQITLEDIAYTLHMGRSHYNLRGAMVVSSLSDLENRLAEIRRHGHGRDYIVHMENAKHVSIDDLTKDKIQTILTNLQQGIEGDKTEYKDNLLALSQYYVKGQVTHCPSLYFNQNVQLLHMPTYPFIGDSYWIDEEQQHDEDKMTSSIVGLHPLLGQNISTWNTQGYEKTWDGSEFFLRDHLVGKNRVLPAVAYIEMARMAGDLANPEQQVVKISNNYWLNSIQVDQEPKKVNITLLPTEEEDNVLEYEVTSEEANERTIVHGKGRICYGDKKYPPFHKEIINLTDIRNRCSQKITGENCYELFQQAGLNLGPSFQSIQEMYFNEEEVLAALQLPKHLQNSFYDFNLHPTIMDGALEAVIGMLSLKVKSQGVRLPYYMSEVNIYRPLQEKCYSYARSTGTKHIGLQETECFDVYIIDEEGNVLVGVKDFSLWEVGKNTKTIGETHDITQKNSQYGEKNKNVEEFSYPMMYYRHEWKENKDVVSDYSHMDKVILIFDKDEALTNHVQEILLKDNVQTILVKPGKVYKEHEDGKSYTLHPTEKDDYSKLFHSLHYRGLLPKHIIYAWAKDVEPDIEYISLEGLDRSIYPLLHLSQAIDQLNPSYNIRLNYIFYEDEGVFSPLSAAAYGFVKSLRLENSHYQYKSIRISSNFPLNQICDWVLKEFHPQWDKHIEVMYKEGQRWVKNLEEVDLDTQALNQPPLTNRGVYIITGGLGSLGFIMAAYLAKEYKARLCLSSLSPLDQEEQEKIRQLESLGSEVLFVQGDCSKLHEVEKLVNNVRTRFGEINGIIHCAGVIKDALLRDKTQDSMRQVLAPKIMGTVYLDLLTKKDKLDFFTLFSSTASITGNLGQTDYAYANSFMDYYAQLRHGLVRKGMRQGKTISYNWPLWKEGGMKVEKETEELFKTIGISTLETEKGIQAFINGMKSPYSRWIVFQGEQKKIREFLGIEKQKEAITLIGNRDKVELKSAVEKDMVQAVKEILRVREKDIYFDKDMKDYGFNSLTFTEFANKINKIYAIATNPSIFYEHGTLQSLADYLVEEHYESISRKHGKTNQVHEDTNQIPRVQDTPRIGLKKEIKRRPSTQIIPQSHSIETTSRKEPIAIVGMSGIAPKSEDLASFWDNLVTSKDLITEVPGERWNTGDLPDNISKWGGFMKDIDKFDPLFFGISPMEAELMDPQQRIFLQTVWETIEDAGYRPSDLSGTKTGLFVGVSTTDYRDVLKDCEIEALTSTGNSHCILANRISYILGIHGPSEPIDTACSSSLVALHRGVQSIYGGDCDMAIVGGVNVMASPTLHISFSKAGMLSPDGRCKTFDKEANGYVRGEGSGAILLKPLSKAIENGDHIYALIKGTSINHGGHATSLTAPNPNAQADLIVETMEKADCDPDTISYIEAHGTGTKLGDPVEINGLKKAFKQMSKKRGIATRKKNYCGIGSVKTNIGHLETAAGIAGVLKVLLAMKHKKLPGTVHLNVQNPFIDLSDSPFYIIKETQDWHRLIDESGTEIPRRAGISSFGFGGSNAHVILEEYNPTQQEVITANGPHIIIISARNKERLSVYAERLYKFLKKAVENEEMSHDQLINIAYTLQVGRNDMGERLAIVVNNITELIEGLDGYIKGNKNIDHLYAGNAKTNRERADFLIDSHSGTHIMDLFVNNKEMDQLANLWVSGIKVDWTKLYREYSPRRIGLPTYPFEKKRIWIKKNNMTVEKKEMKKSKKEDKRHVETFEPSTSILDCFYQYSWQPSPLVEKVVSISKEEGDRNILILVPIDFKAIAYNLQEKYHSKDQVRIILLGTRNYQHHDNHWEIDVADSHALNNCLQDIIELDRIYFLGGLVSNITRDTLDVKDLDRTQEQGVMTLLRLIKGLEKKDMDNQRIQFKIWTNKVHTLNNEGNIPYAGSILGLAKTMAKEFSSWEVSCVDMDITELEGEDEERLLSMLIDEPANKKGDEVVIRQGIRYVSSIQPAALQKSSQAPFKKEGVYVILGGAGGIGLELSRYLSKNYQAKVGLIGRSPLTPEKKKIIAEIEALGGKILYVRGDATDLDSIKQALKRVKDHFGSINGGVHSAIVMKDRALCNMTEEDLRAALVPKVMGSVLFYEALKGEKLDFMLFFSSIQTFVGNLGQGNYAAACAFKDAYAAYLNKICPYPIKVINWGYWGSVGVASSEEYNKRIRATGLESIEPEEGMEAIHSFLSSPDLEQIIVIKATDALLKQIGIHKESPSKVIEPIYLPVKESKGENTRDIRSAIKEAIIENIGDVLKVPSGEVESDMAFSEYGVDSITGMELVNKINETLSLSLKRTVLFDYTNVDDLADYLYDTYGADISQYLYAHNPHSSQQTSESISPHRVSQEELSLIVEEKVAKSIAEALKVDSSEVDFDMQFSDYGVDSITGLTLTKIINNTFDISLKSTILFDYSNIRDFSSYLCETYGDKIVSSIYQDDTTFIGEMAVDDDIDLFNQLVDGEVNVDDVLRKIG